MEELQSTEILDREILEDARKKSLRTLKTADDTVRSQSAEWEKRAAESIDDLDKKHNEQKELAAEKIMARLPIDKRRTKVEKIENLLNSAVESWYKSLNREQILTLLSNELKKRVSLCEDFASSAEKRAFFSCLEQKEAETIIKKVNLSCPLEESLSAGHFPSIVLESKKARISSSIQEIVDYLLQEKREELVEALVGSDYMRLS